ncbi:hypothetical protein [Stenotrophomonas maltophilia]|uniref:hypothetical protein n=1 Tax=Stenotrophomonas maltophilia TaxID=40324 RepID=UPI0015C54B77|nr:hypothetical protein [Stenotrophomonas maltophilia]
MIYVFQNKELIPDDWLEKVKLISEALEKLKTKEERKKYIDNRKAIWGEIKDALLKMSHGKCWYSEAPDAVSDWHVDHFRPKGRSVDQDDSVHDGYDWLAFDWTNYRIAGSYSNSPHKDEQDRVRGKWDYFPLANGSFRASLADKRIERETCLILDPARRSDPKLITFDENGLPRPSDPNNAIVRKKVETTTYLLFLDSPRLIAARKKKWREVTEWIDTYRESTPDNIENCSADDYIRLEKLIERLQRIAGPQADFSSTARACLRANALEQFLQQIEGAQI